VRCQRCWRTQPPLPPGVTSCVFCSAPLPVQRWIAHPPASAMPPAAVPPVRRRTWRGPYAGPPTYGPRHPMWGFPRVAWRSGEVIVSADDEPVRQPLRGLFLAQAVCLVAALLAATAGGAEIWRWVLMLRGRTEVLPDRPVEASDLLVAVAGWLAVGAAVVAAAVVVPVVLRLHAAATDRADLPRTRRPASVLALLVLPGWNLYGAGAALSETDVLLQRTDADREPDETVRPSRWVTAWWVLWILSAVATVAALVRAFGTSSQAIADTVELHLIADLLAAGCAGLTVPVLGVFRRRWLGRVVDFVGWRVAGPAPTRPAGAQSRTSADPVDAERGASAQTTSAISAGFQVEPKPDTDCELSTAVRMP
jgi:hypothetical protein